MRWLKHSENKRHGGRYPGWGGCSNERDVIAETQVYGLPQKKMLIFWWLSRKFQQSESWILGQKWTCFCPLRRKSQKSNLLSQLVSRFETTLIPVKIKKQKLSIQSFVGWAQPSSPAVSESVTWCRTASGFATVPLSGEPWKGGGEVQRVYISRNHGIMGHKYMYIHIHTQHIYVYIYIYLTYTHIRIFKYGDIDIWYIEIYPGSA